MKKSRDGSSEFSAETCGLCSHLQGPGASVAARPNLVLIYTSTCGLFCGCGVLTEPQDQCEMIPTLEAPLSFSLLPESSPKSSYSERGSTRQWMKRRLEHRALPKGQAEEAVPCSPMGARSMWLWSWSENCSLDRQTGRRKVFQVGRGSEGCLQAEPRKAG